MRQPPRPDVLRGYKSFSKTISEGRSLLVMPIRGYYTVSWGKAQWIHFGVAVSKAVSNAAQRNFIKRRIREGYRLNRDAFLEQLAQSKSSVNLVLLYVGRPSNVKKEAGFLPIHHAIQSLLPRIASAIVGDES